MYWLHAQTLTLWPGGQKVDIPGIISKSDNILRQKESLSFLISLLWTRKLFLEVHRILLFMWYCPKTYHKPISESITGKQIRTATIGLDQSESTLWDWGWVSVWQWRRQWMSKLNQDSFRTEDGKENDCWLLPRGWVIGKVKELSLIWISTGENTNKKDTGAHEEDSREELVREHMPPVLSFLQLALPISKAINALLFDGSTIKKKKSKLYILLKKERRKKTRMQFFWGKLSGVSLTICA